MTDMLLALCTEWEKRADESDKSSYSDDLLPKMSDVFMVEAATMRRMARELRRRIS